MKIFVKKLRNLLFNFLIPNNLYYCNSTKNFYVVDIGRSATSSTFINRLYHDDYAFNWQMVTRSNLGLWKKSYKYLRTYKILQEVNSTLEVDRLLSEDLKIDRRHRR